MLNVESNKLKCSDCRSCIPLINSGRRSPVAAICSNEDIPFQEVNPQWTPDKNLEYRGWLNRAEQIRRGNFNCFYPRLTTVKS